MWFAGRWIAWSLLLAAPVLPGENLVSPTAAPQATPHRKSHSKKAQQPLVLPPLPGGPLSQLPMDQIPASPAKVSYQDGLLSISAENSTLGEILRDVRKITGATIEIPQGSGASERVVTRLGPGAPRDVLSGLLNGSPFNYVILGTDSDPTAISSLILTAKPSATGQGGQTQTAANVYQNNPGQNNPGAIPPNRFPQAFNQSLVPQPGQAAVVQQANTEADDDSKDDEDNADDNADDSAEAQPGQTVQPVQPGAAGAEVQDQAQPQDPNQPNAGPRTPEQILEMMRRPQQPGGPVMPPVGQQPPQQ